MNQIKDNPKVSLFLDRLGLQENFKKSEITMNHYTYSTNAAFFDLLLDDHEYLQHHSPSIT